MVKIKCAVVGGSGYIGGELLRLLLSHPHVDLVAITANELAGETIAKVHPNLSHINRIFNPLGDVNNADVLFLALPHGSAVEFVKRFPDKIIIDTSADFRWQNTVDKHSIFCYGLPELFRTEIKTARNIAAPGCFATAAILSIYPLVAEKLAEDIIINAVTGSSGSGIKPKDKAHHPLRADSFFAYELFTHRHIPEIKQTIKNKTSQEINMIFQPHSGPFIRGIYATSIIKLRHEITKIQLLTIFKNFYAGEYFIRFPEAIPNIKWVKHSNFCDISVETQGKTAIIITTIDNLLKGGAGQAIQCFNIMHGLAETLGLTVCAANP